MNRFVGSAIGILDRSRARQRTALGTPSEPPQGAETAPLNESEAIELDPRDLAIQFARRSRYAEALAAATPLRNSKNALQNSPIISCVMRR